MNKQLPYIGLLVFLYFIHCRVVGLLIEKCRDVIKYKDCNGDMALHLACRRGHLEVVKEILDLEPTTVGMKYT